MPDRLTRHDIRERLYAGPCRGVPGTELEKDRLEGHATGPIHPAGVLLPLYRQADAWHLLFIRRTEHHQDRHSGQVSFPGGRHQEDDTDCIATALRETREEIGLDPSRVEVLGTLRPLQTVSRFLVTPVVGCLPWPQALRPDPREVARIFSIPLAWLADPAHHQIRLYPEADHPEARNLIFFDRYAGELLWGVSAQITLDFLRCLQAESPAPPD